MNIARKAPLAALCMAASAAASAAFPDKPIKVVIGFPAGGPLDQHARLLTDKLQAVLGQPVHRRLQARRRRHGGRRGGGQEPARRLHADAGQHRRGGDQRRRSTASCPTTR